MRGGAVTVCIAAAALLACTQQKSTVSRNANEQTIAITDSLLKHGGSDTLRFGRLHRGERAVKRFVLRNETATPVVVIRHETTCNCTSFEYARRPILPDSLSTVTCTFDSSGESGWQFKLVKLRLSGADEPLRLFIEAEVGE